tara:strand:- start:1500 stop:2219 length:720 start_codon:yes stop_codon:yes gene_type:complete
MDFVKFDRIAVVLVGHYRTFSRLNDQYIWFFKNLANKVDYYMYVWDDPLTLTLRDISPYLGNYLKKCEIVNTNDCRSDNKIYRLSYLAAKAQKAKLKVEQDENFVYDYVVETRPDLRLRHQNDFSKHFVGLQDNEIIVEGADWLGSYDRWKEVDRKWVPSDGADTFFTTNWYFRMTSNTYNQFADRQDFYKDFKYTDFHKDLCPYFISNPQFVFSKHNDVIEGAIAVSEKDVLENNHRR